MDATPAPAIPPKPQRIASVDAYRGFVMFLMMAEVLRIATTAKGFPGSSLWALLTFHTSHVEWTGCSLHDLIQPSFSFLVGVALPFSIAARAARGQPCWVMALHALWRAVLLVLLGVFLRSVGKAGTNWTFEDTLSQIGLGYPFLFALGFAPRRWQWTALGVILFGYWLAWATWPVATPDYDFAKVGVSAEWMQQHGLHGFAAHWQKNANIGFALDQWLGGHVRRAAAFNAGGYLTLSFIPTLGTMLLGLLAGGWLRNDNDKQERLAKLAGACVACFALALALHMSGACPIVKRIWTPAWVLFSGGWCFALLTAFYVVMDLGGLKRWAFPLTVIGANSIAAYCIAHLFHDFINGSLRTHLGAGFFDFAGEKLAPLMQGAAVLLIYWLILFWMHRRKIFLRI
jgi:predicted acyltransferase